VFCWHGVDSENKTRMIPNKEQFTRIKIIPDQFYYNVSIPHNRLKQGHDYIPDRLL
jgi:hypothetical protein